MSPRPSLASDITFLAFASGASSTAPTNGTEEIHSFSSRRRSCVTLRLTFKILGFASRDRNDVGRLPSKCPILNNGQSCTSLDNEANTPERYPPTSCMQAEQWKLALGHHRG